MSVRVCDSKSLRWRCRLEFHWSKPSLLASCLTGIGVNKQTLAQCVTVVEQLKNRSYRWAISPFVFSIKPRGCQGSSDWNVSLNLTHCSLGISPLGGHSSPLIPFLWIHSIILLPIHLNIDRVTPPLPTCPSALIIQPIVHHIIGLLLLLIKCA